MPNIQRKKPEPEVVEEILMPREEVIRDQDKIETLAGTLDHRVHSNAVQCLMHAAKHGDVSLMERLLTRTIKTESGYRRQALINWVRKHSPMELKGKTMNLSGQDKEGNRRPFKIEEASQTPFWMDEDNAEKVAKPFGKDDFLKQLRRAISQGEVALENTGPNGAPINATVAFVAGDKSTLQRQIEKMKKAVAEIA